MKNDLYRRATAMLLFICLISSAAGMPSAGAAAGQTAFDIRSNVASVRVGDSFVVTVDGLNLDRLYAYELTLELPSGVAFASAKARDYLPGGMSVYRQEGYTLRYGSTKTGQSAGESGALPLAGFTLEANASGSAEIKLVSVKTLDPELRATMHEVQKKIVVEIGSQQGNGNNN
ncbi:cohesin domain-containing protein, partial [Cohnella sp. JJ-181]|uniref:cohesin domain-containing protein n=1 Tax=Cohnella rhizoplanae TaxID=2974897 RepID=UPI00232D18AD